MFSFTQLCEYYTATGHSWFYFSRRLLDCIDKQERGDIEIENIDTDTVRIFFPSMKRFTGLDRDAINKLVSEAVADNDWERVKQLKGIIKI